MSVTTGTTFYQTKAVVSVQWSNTLCDSPHVDSADHLSVYKLAKHLLSLCGPSSSLVHGPVYLEMRRLKMKQGWWWRSVYGVKSRCTVTFNVLCEGGCSGRAVFFVHQPEWVSSNFSFLHQIVIQHQSYRLILEPWILPQAKNSFQVFRALLLCSCFVVLLENGHRMAQICLIGTKLAPLESRRVAISIRCWMKLEVVLNGFVALWKTSKLAVIFYALECGRVRTSGIFMISSIFGPLAYRLVGTLYFKKHLSAFVILGCVQTPVQHFNSITGEIKGERHQQWYGDIRRIVSDRICSEEERMPSYRLLWRHWVWSFWMAQMWKHSPQADVYFALTPP